MSYTPPVGNNLQFQFPAGAYTPPAGNNLQFDFSAANGAASGYLASATGFVTGSVGQPILVPFAQGFQVTSFGHPRLNAEQATGFLATSFGTPVAAFKQIVQATWVGGETPDPYWEYRTFLLRGEGVNGSTVIVEETNKLITMRRQVTTVTDQHAPVAGSTASLLFTNTTATPYIVFAPDTGFNSFGLGDFIIEGWFRLQTPVPPYAYLLWTDAWYLGFDSNGSYLVFKSVNEPGFIRPLSYVTEDVWHHFEVNRISGEMRIFLDGEMSPFSPEVYGGDMSAPNSSLWVGAANGSADGERGIACHLDNIRITKVVQGHTSNFAVPTEDYKPGIAYGTGQNLFGLPRAKNFNVAPTIGRVTTFGTPTTPFLIEAAVEGFQATKFGEWYYSSVTGVQNKAGRAVGFNNTEISEPSVRSSVSVAASGFKPTGFGTPLSGRAVFSTGFGSTAFGTPSLKQTCFAVGWVSISVSRPFLKRGQQATGTKFGRFGSAVAERSNVYKVRGFGAIPRIGTPAAKQGLLKRTSGSQSTSFGTPAARFKYRAMHTPPVARFGATIMQRTPLC